MGIRPGRHLRSESDAAPAERLRVLESLLRPLVAELNRSLHFERCSIALYDEPAGKVIPVVAVKRSEGRLRRSRIALDEGVALRVAKTREALCITDASTDGSLGDERGSLICVPLLHNNRPIGALTIGEPSPDAFSSKDILRLASFGQRMAFTLHFAEDIATMRWHPDQLAAIAKLNANLLRKLDGEGVASAQASDNNHTGIDPSRVRDKDNQLNLMKGNFITMVSRELRAPLSVIKGFVEILLSGKAGKLRPLQIDFIDSIRTSTDTLTQLVDDILDLARLDAGQLLLEREVIDLVEMAARIDQAFQRRAVEAGVALQNNIRGTLPHLRGDRCRLEQVLNHLVANALKFTPSGGNVTLEAAAIETGVVISVVDNGIGIPAAEQGNVFERFYQVEGGAGRRFGGNGLGLALAKKLIERQGGTIWVESAPGGGSRFLLSVPVTSSPGN